MSKLIPFQRRSATAYALALTARLERVSKSKPWTRSHVRPERLGNLLQYLTAKRPAVVYVIESMVADIVAQIDADEEETG